MNPWLSEEWAYVKTLFGKTFRRKRLSFMSLHYLFIIAMTIATSILLYPAGGLSYIDSLFFAAGSCTQSGLNTIDLNKMLLFQQIVLYLLPMLTNPIVIHTSVVFIRLYWFEKRFQTVVKDAMAWRRTKSKAIGETQAREEASNEKHLRGVNGRNITVLDDGKTVGPAYEDQAPFRPMTPTVEPFKSREESRNQNGEAAPIRREITFAEHEEVISPPARLPEHISTEQHIAFLENQRNPKDKGILRIPGPREFDEGGGPQTLDEDDALSKQATRSYSVTAESHDSNDHPQSHGALRNHITFEENARPGLSPIQSRPSTVHFQPATSITSRTSRLSRDLRTPGPYTPGNPGFGPSTGGTPGMRPRSATFSSIMRSDTKPDVRMPYLSWQPTVGRNSAFVDLTEEQREELGGIEYRALKTLAKILVGYFLLWHLVGIIVLIPWIKLTPSFGRIVDDVGVNRTWWGIFSSATLFNDVGFTLTPDSFISFQGAAVPLLLGSYLIIIGNTGFPCLLRFTIWALSKGAKEGTPYWQELKFLLDHPRRCFTLLFPSNATWVLFAILILLNGIDLIFFIILDLNDEAVTSIPPGYRVLAGLFQAASTRTAGTAAVNLANLHPGIQVSYLIMMYISVFPIAISMRRTNVYEEKSLGIYTAPEDGEDTKSASYISAHLQKQLQYDLWFIFLGLFIITIVEGYRIEDPSQTSFTVFACLFEIVSAYGTVGLSLGYPTVNTSLSGEFRTVSKLIIIAMMVRGRHRGLPYQLDRAVLLPSESLHRKEDLDASMRAGRTPTVPNTGVLTAFPSQRRLSRGSHHQDFFPEHEYAVESEPEHVQSAPATATGVDASSPTSDTVPARRGIGRVMAGVNSSWSNSSEISAPRGFSLSPDINIGE